jgi:drug/metabolite transporter (DMT)-like permease
VLKTRTILLIVAALYGTNFGSIKVMQETLPPSTAALLRFTLALGALSPYLASTPRALWRPGLEIGLWVALGYVVQGIGLDSGSSASTAAFLCSLAVVVCPLLDKLDGVKIARKTWGAAGLAVLGVAVLEITGGKPPSTGDLWSLLQPVGFGMGFWKIEKVMRDFPGKGKELTAIQLVVVWVMGALWSLYDNGGSLPDFAQVSGTMAQLPVAAAVLWTGLITTALTVLLQTTSLGVLSSSETTVLYSTEPVWAAAFASVVLGEEISVNTLVGGAMIMAACILSTTTSEGEGEADTADAAAGVEQNLLIEGAPESDSKVGQARNEGGEFPVPKRGVK